MGLWEKDDSQLEASKEKEQDDEIPKSEPPETEVPSQVEGNRSNQDQLKRELNFTAAVKGVPF